VVAGSVVRLEAVFTACVTVREFVIRSFILGWFLRRFSCALSFFAKLPCRTGDGGTGFVHTFPLFTDTTFTTGDAGAEIRLTTTRRRVTAVPHRTIHSVTKILHTLSIGAFFARLALYPCTAFNADSQTTEFTILALHIVAGVGCTSGVETDFSLFAGFEIVAIVFATGVVDTKLIGFAEAAHVRR
jgi:hypothetical protein